MDKTKLEQIFERLQVILPNAYAPYSNFRCAAICQVKTDFFCGVNVENAAYPVGICAEKSATAVAISWGHRHIDAVFLLADSPYITPCGACRQFLSEFSVHDHLCVYTFAQDKTYKKYLIGELLFDRFSKKNLKP